MPKNYRRALVIFTIFVLYITYLFAQNYVHYMDLQKELADIEEEVIVLKEDKHAYEKQLEYAGSIEYVERVAREKLGLVKEGETLMVVIEE